MKKFLILATCLFIIACENSSQKDVRVTIPIDGKQNFSSIDNIVSKMRVLTLESADNVVLSSDNIVKCNEDYIVIIDRLHSGQIHIFNIDGSYRATIAAKGRGPNEYLDMASVQLSDDRIMIYSYHKQAVLYYDYNGKFIESDQLEYKPYNLHKTDSGYWGYVGFGSGQMKERVVKMDGNGAIIDKYLPTKAKIYSVTEINDIFIECAEGILVRESLMNEISIINDNGASSYMSFDFGKYTIPSQYYEYSDPMKAAKMLFATDFAMIEEFFVLKQGLIMYVSRNMQGAEQSSDVVAIMRNGEWICIETNKEDALLHKSVKGVTNNDEIVLLQDEASIRTFAEQHSKLLPAAELKNISNNDDKYHIVLCQLK